MENKNGISGYLDAIWLAVGEAVVSLIVSLVYFFIGKFEYKVVTGALLGSLVIVVNFLILCVAVNRALSRYINELGCEQMDDEAAEKYAKEHGTAVQNAMMKSYIFRMLLMIGALVLAMLSGFFSPLATAIPLVMYRPILYVVEMIKSKIQKRRGA